MRSSPLIRRGATGWSTGEYAVSPTVEAGYILKASADLLRLMSYVTGQPPVVLPITTQDITPYGNGVDHLNSIMRPGDRDRASGGRGADRRDRSAGMRERG